MTIESGVESAGPATSACVVGVGASAGGLRPLRKLLSEFRPEDGLCFVVLLHQGVHEKSMVLELIASVTPLRVTNVVDGLIDLEPGVVYLVPPGLTVTFDGRAFGLSEANATRLPIDTMFASLAQRFGAHAAGIVLSGTGTDGALGLKAIAAAGGVAMAQRPESAEFDGMPRAALATGVVTQSLDVEAMSDPLVTWAAHCASPARPEGQRVQALRDILELVGARQNFDFSGYKPTMLLRRVRRRMQLMDVDSLTEYVARLERASDEVEALFRDLLIGVTEFFRDPPAWDALQREVIDPLVADKVDGETIRVWVAGCSSGEESYTLSMLLIDAMRRAGRTCQLQVFATDGDERAIAVARRAIYPAAIVEQVGQDRLARYFTTIDDGQRVQCAAELRRNVIFGVQNLLSDPPFNDLDLVTCRNLLIYLQPEVQQRVLAMFHFALKPGGHLFVGKAETAVTPDGLFKVVSSKSRIFARAGGARRLNAPFRLTQIPTHKPLNEMPATLFALPHGQAAQLVQKLIVDRFGPPCVLIDAECEVLHFSGPTDGFLLQPRGAPTHNLIALVRDGLRSRLRAAVIEAVSTGAEVRARHVHVKRDDDYVEAAFTVIPVRLDAAPTRYLIVFEDEPAPLPSRTDRAPADDAVMRSLERELSATRDDLQATIVGLEASNEELRIANEEVISVNEELQTRNEELQSSKEELQSLNEELGAVNQQVQLKLSELEVANSDLSNLLNSNDVAILRVDRDNCIRWFSPSAQRLLQLLGGDVGRAVQLFSPPLLGEPLLADVAEVAARGEPMQRELQNRDGRWYLRRTIPYRASDGRTDGAIVTMTDVTEARREQQTRDEHSIANASRLELLVDERTEQLRRLSYERTRVEESERKAIAEDLHDNLLQILIAAQLKLSQARAGGEAALLKVAEALDILTRATQQLRSLAYQLSPGVLTDVGLVAALGWLVGDMKKIYGTQVELSDDGAPKEVNALVGAVVFRAVREFLINVARHAKTLSSQVVMRRDGDFIEVRVIDQGCGFDPGEMEQGPWRGMGLRGARERLSLIGGSMQITSQPGLGSTVTLRAPLGKASLD